MKEQETELHKQKKPEHRQEKIIQHDTETRA